MVYMRFITHSVPFGCPADGANTALPLKKIAKRLRSYSVLKLQMSFAHILAIISWVVLAKVRHIHSMVGIKLFSVFLTPNLIRNLPFFLARFGSAFLLHLEYFRVDFAPLPSLSVFLLFYPWFLAITLLGSSYFGLILRQRINLPASIPAPMPAPAQRIFSRVVAVFCWLM